jgi:protein-S-isoprenylcysteine O-methyltransferase Ste14
MRFQFDSMATLPLVSRLLVAAGYLGFFAFLLLKPKPQETERKRENVSILGIALQSVGYALAWMLQRNPPRPGEALTPVEIVLDVLAPLLVVLSAWIGLAAVRTLGRQWAYAARLVEGHRLVTEGPYRIVRHPIYTAMFGMLLATCFAFGHWLGWIVGGTVFVAGTLIRIRSEEKLLREAFGAEYEDFARRVKAFVPLVL